ncbi:hypothetical protein C2W27_14345 [Salmonella enterica]|nr:hypothetical protein [Salmonella enterica]
MKQSKNSVITMAQIRAAGGCASGVRAFFSRYGLDFRAFMANGIEAETLLATGDALAVDVVTKARALESE